MTIKLPDYWSNPDDALVLQGCKTILDLATPPSKHRMVAREVSYEVRISRRQLLAMIHQARGNKTHRAYAGPIQLRITS
jgi:hypothetical protein